MRTLDEHKINPGNDTLTITVLDEPGLLDGFVRRIMAQHTSMKGSDLPQGLVDAYRELMKIKRAINEKRG